MKYLNISSFLQIKQNKQTSKVFNKLCKFRQNSQKSIVNKNYECSDEAPTHLFLHSYNPTKFRNSIFLFEMNFFLSNLFVCVIPLYRIQRIQKNPCQMSPAKPIEPALHKRIDSAAESLNKPDDLIKITEINEEQAATQMVIPKPDTHPLRQSPFDSFIRCLFWCQNIFKVAQEEWDEIQLEKQIRRVRSLIVKPVIQPPKSNRKMLVLDLNRTLVYYGQKLEKWDFTLKFESLRKPCRMFYFKKRFGVEYFIKEMTKYYDVVIWSKEDEEFVKKVVAQINPDKNVQHILWNQHCTKLNSVYAKNLNILGRKLKNIVLLTSDDASAILHPDNCTQINSFEGNQRDRELIKQTQFLKYLSSVDDARPIPRHLMRFNRKQIKIGKNYELQPGSSESRHLETPVGRMYRQNRVCRRRSSNLSDISEKSEKSVSQIHHMETQYIAMRTESLQSEASQNEDSTKYRTNYL